QVQQDVEDLRFERDLFGASPELSPAAVEDIIVKSKLHESLSWRRLAPASGDNHARLANKSSDSPSFRGRNSACCAPVDCSALSARLPCAIGLRRRRETHAGIVPRT